MTDRLRVVLIVAVLVYFIVVLRLLKQKKLSLKYTLLWLLVGVIMSCLVLVPRLLKIASHTMGIVDTMNGLFTFSIGFIIVLLLALTSIASKQSERIKDLIQDNALLEKRIRELEKESKR